MRLIDYLPLKNWGGATLAETHVLQQHGKGSKKTEKKTKMVTNVPPSLTWKDPTKICKMFVVVAIVFIVFSFLASVFSSVEKDSQRCEFFEFSPK